MGIGGVHYCMGEHTDTLRQVEKGDNVTITTTLDETYDFTCEMHDVQKADPRTGEIRETHIWQFNNPTRRISATITDGLKSSPDDPDFPIHSEVYEFESDASIGYIDKLEIHSE